MSVSRISRRRMLAFTGAGIAGWSLGLGCGASAAPARTTRRARPSVVVIGGGVAGLTTAHWLQARGWDVTVLEAQPRVGGRVLTVREPFHEELYVEAGATHVVGEPDLLALMEEVGVEVYRPERGPRLPSVVLDHGQRRVLAEGEADPNGPVLSETERALEWPDFIGHYFGDAATGDPRSREWLGARAQHDTTSAEQLLRERGASAGYLATVQNDLAMGESLGELSATWLMQQVAAIRQEMAWGGGGRVRGGADMFPRAIAARLGDRVQLGATVRAIAHGHDGARVRFDRDGASHVLAADHAVIAVHAPAIASLSIDPPLPTDTRAALATVRTSSVVRPWVELDRRIWIDAGISGTVRGDALGPVKDETAGVTATHGILGGYIGGSAARQLMTIAEPDRLARFVELVERAHPGARAHVSATAIKSWDEDPWARGAYTWAARGYLTGSVPALTRPIGRLHLAGDYASYRPGFMQGAVQSAKRVVAEILAVQEQRRSAHSGK